MHSLYHTCPTFRDKTLQPTLYRVVPNHHEYKLRATLVPQLALQMHHSTGKLIDINLFAENDLIFASTVRQRYLQNYTIRSEAAITPSV